MIAIIPAIVFLLIFLSIGFAVVIYIKPKIESYVNKIYEKATEPQPTIAIHRKYLGNKRYVKAPPIHNQYKHKDLI